MKKVDAKVNFPDLEKRVLQYWQEERIFEKSVERRPAEKTYAFYDGPPFATGTPHYGHFLPSTLKDLVPRYFTMQGFRVSRRWGWDCHGLPIENIVEKELGITNKKQIVELGIAKFNELCRSKVLQYADDWKMMMGRFGRWADMENAYRTMDRDYMESVWWVFKELWDKDLIYESYRSMHICPRCETTLSQAEVSEGYVTLKDLAVTVKFELLDEPGTYLLAWTTTPWTLLGNVALALSKNIAYTKVESEGERYIVALNRIQDVFAGKEYRQIEEVKASDLIGRSYKAPFDYYQNDQEIKNYKNGWKVYPADFVTTEVGTGIAHEAPAFGEEDMELSREFSLPWIQHVNMDGTVKEEVPEFSGQQVKPKENIQAFDVEIVRALAKKNLLFAKEKYEHSYPLCWRCDTPLLNYATTSWFVAVEKMKPDILQAAKAINWSPSHLKVGRFGKWLEGARDWSISRQRFWANVIPIWECQCGERRVFGSAAELEEASGQKVEDLHKHIVDEVTLPCEKCRGVMRRIPDVLDTWFDSGSMPYGSSHYPFESKESFEKHFPAQFIAEGLDQTRAWFYYLHVLATALKDSAAFENAVVHGIVLAEDGRKMSKRLKNYPDPMHTLDTYGSDALRLYLLSSPVVAAENLSFSERDLRDVTGNVMRMLWNSYSFFTTYAVIDNWQPKAGAPDSKNILDRWILSELQTLNEEVTSAMDGYQINQAARAFAPFADDLSNWYIRRSRRRFWKNENDVDKEEAYQTLYTVLTTLSKLMAPFTPFVTEEIYRNLTGEESVHLADWPEASKSSIDKKLMEHMRLLRGLVATGLQKRSEKGIKVRQPLNNLILPQKYAGVFDEALNKADWSSIITDELNVKKISLGTGIEVDFDWIITPELKLEGEAREIIRAIQEGRKKAGFNVEDRIRLGYAGKEKAFEKFGDEIAREVLAAEVRAGEAVDAEYREELILEGEPLSFSLKRA